MELRFLSLWSINAPLVLDELTAQLDELKRLGMQGVVFHPRNYPGKPEYLSQAYMDVLSALILHAKGQDMAFWLYDENGWPSGTAGGAVMQHHPDFTRAVLMPDLSIRKTPGVSVIEPGHAQAFIELTHERYAAGLSPEAFDWVEGFFTDEVGLSNEEMIETGCLPWCSDMPEEYRSPQLFAGEEGASLRTAYWEKVSELLRERFYQPIRDWCIAHGKQFTGHMKGEENPYFQVPFSGSIYGAMRCFTLPGVDALERRISNPYYPSIASSAARQFGNGHAMAEAMGGSGWGVNPQDEEDYILFLAKAGINTVILHLNQLRLDESDAQDWPPSRPCHLTWKEAYPAMLERIRQKARALPATPADTLLVIPARGCMAGYLPGDGREMNIHDGSLLPDVSAARDAAALVELAKNLRARAIAFDVADEVTCEREGRWADGVFCLGACRYSRVITAGGACCTVKNSATPEQTPWQVVAFDGERKIPQTLRKKDDAHFMAEEPFIPAAADAPADAGNLIAAGFGFCPAITLCKRVRLDRAGEGTLLLSGIAASAACIRVDGGDPHYTWGPDWLLPKMQLAPGWHTVEVTLYNSGYNVYGPHHYYRGDAPLCSPMHYAGEKHFGDPPDAPANTHVPYWHFVPLHLFGPVHLLDARS